LDGILSRSLVTSARYRVPNPKIEGAEKKVFVETLYNIAVACDVASTFYKKEVAPIFEVILPFTTDAKELIWLYEYYRRTIAATEEVFLGENMKVKDWIGCFGPKSIEVIPLIEDFESILNADKIVEPYIRVVKPRYLRVFIARSDPALNYGVLCAVLLSKLALSKLKLLENKLGSARAKSFTGASVQGKSVLPLVEGEASSVRDIAVSTPSLIKGVGTGLRATVTTDKWSLILAPGTSMEDAEKIEITFIVDGEPRTLKPVGKINTELYNLKSDPKQERNLVSEETETAKNIQAKFIGFLSELGASRETISPWLKCRGLN
jgi:hypothetical protein